MPPEGKSRAFPQLGFWPWLQLILGGFIAWQAITMAMEGSYTGRMWLKAVLALWLLWSFISAWREARATSEMADAGGDGVGKGDVEAAARPALPGSGDATAEEEDSPPRSLVYLLDQPREIHDDRWINHLGQALGVDLSSKGGDALNFVMPMPHPAFQREGDSCFMLKIPEGMFWIFNVSHPYVDDVEEWSSSMRDKRLRDAVAGHRAWISVDFISAAGNELSKEETYAVLGRVIAALAGPDVRVVLAPELGRANEFDPMLLPRLSGGNPIEVFDEPTYAPVIDHEGDSALMDDAIEEARRRWPEFVARFNSHSPGEGDKPFIVKYPFSDEEGTEHMWMSVERIEGGTIHGTLLNQPHHLVDFHEGQKVSVEASRLTDWLCEHEGQALGGWSMKVLDGES